MAKQPSPIDEYLETQPADVRKLYVVLRKQLKKLCPDSVDAISYQMPTLKWNGKNLISFAIFKDHTSLFPHSGHVIERLADELEGCKRSKGGISFARGSRLPDQLVEKIIHARRSEIEKATKPKVKRASASARQAAGAGKRGSVKTSPPRRKK